MTRLRVPRWIGFCALSVLLYGIWGVVATAATNAMGNDPHAALTLQVIATLGLLPVCAALLFSRNLREGNQHGREFFFAFLTGIGGAVGNVFLFSAVTQGGETSTVYPLTGMYPLVTVLLALALLRERLNGVQVVGILIALCALFLLNSEATTSLNGFRNLLTLWMGYSLLALVLWGITGVTQKLAIQHISTALCMVGFAAAFIPVAVVILVVWQPHLNVPARAWGLSLLNGALTGLSVIASYAAYRDGKASIVTALIAIYPVVTVILAVPLFGDTLGARKIIGIALALAAAAALTYEKQREETTTPQP